VAFWTCLVSFQSGGKPLPPTPPQLHMLLCLVPVSSQSWEVLTWASPRSLNALSDRKSASRRPSLSPHAPPLSGFPPHATHQLLSSTHLAYSNPRTNCSEPCAPRLFMR